MKDTHIVDHNVQNNNCGSIRLRRREKNILPRKRMYLVRLVLRAHKSRSHTWVIVNGLDAKIPEGDFYNEMHYTMT